MITILVEGHSEVDSLPFIVRRFIGAVGAYQIYDRVNRPIRVHRYRVVKPGELEKTCELALRLYPATKALMLVLDADDDCPQDLGPSLLERMKEVPGLICSAVLARTELEAWFLASIESLRGQRGIRHDASPPDKPEDIRDAKGWLTATMQDRTYVPTDDQTALARLFDFELASQRSRSFRKFQKDIQEIIFALSNT